MEETEAWARIETGPSRDRDQSHFLPRTLYLWGQFIIALRPML